MLLLSPEECYFIKSLMIHCLYLMIFDDTLATEENREGKRFSSILIIP
jgi:hypothetical protein